MARNDLNRAVELLLADPSFLRRFRRNPERALRGLDLAAEEIAALKAGDARELVRLGVDPAYVWPRAEDRAPQRAWFLRNGRRLAPATFVVALLAVAGGAGTAQAVRGRRVALRRLTRNAGLHRTGLRRAVARVVDRGEKPPPGLRRAVRRAGLTGIRRAISRVAPTVPTPDGK